MKGSLVNRGRNRWAIVIDHHVTDPTGIARRKQKWISFRGDRKSAEIQLTALIGASNAGTFVAPIKTTVGEWLIEWLEKSVQPTKRLHTFTTYRSVVHGALIPALGAIKLQALKPIDVQRYYADHATLAPRTLGLHSATLSAALKSAVRNGLVTRNVVSLADGKPKVEKCADDIAANVLDVAESRRLLAAAKAAGPRVAAFYALALDSGARIGELAAAVDGHRS